MLPYLSALEIAIVFKGTLQMSRFTFYGRPAQQMRTLYFAAVVSIFFFCFSSPNLSGRRLDVYHTWCGLSTNLGCRSEMCCTRLAGNTGRKTDAKKSPSEHHRTNLSSYVFATKACIDSRKNMLNSNISRFPTTWRTSAH